MTWGSVLGVITLKAFFDQTTKIVVTGINNNKYLLPLYKLLALIIVAEVD